MKFSRGSVVNLAPIPTDAWNVIFQVGPEAEIEICPVIGWATVVTVTGDDGSMRTEIQPAFLWGDMVWIEQELREHTPTLTAFDVRRLQGLGDVVALRREVAGAPKPGR